MSNPIIEFKDPVKLKVAQCHPRDWNPNSMSPEKFNQLAEKIADEGFTGGINVSPVPPDEIDPSWPAFDKHYWIWAGEHRWKCLKTQGIEEIPAYIYEGPEWDTRAQKLKMVRDNLVHGELDDRKFTDLVRSLDDDLVVDHRLLGFEDEAEMLKHLIVEKETAKKDFLDGYVDAASKQQEAVDSLSDVVSTLYSQVGATLDQDYMVMTHQGRLCLIVLCDKDARKQVDALIGHVTRTGESVPKLMTTLIKQGLASAASDAKVGD